MKIDRRVLMAAGLLPWPVRAQPTPRDLAPAASDVAAWASYGARLVARRADAGGGRFDPEMAGAALDLANTARLETGAGSLSSHPELEAAAAAHAADLLRRGYLEHLSPEGFDPSHRLWLVGRTTIGSPSENIAFHRGPGLSASRLLESWRRSPAHWRNLLRTDHTHAGLAVVRQGDRAWLVGLFARPLAWLDAPLPLRPAPARLQAALDSLPPVLTARLAPPQGARSGVDGKVRQITVLRRTDARRYEAIGGPIVLPD